MVIKCTGKRYRYACSKLKVYGELAKFVGHKEFEAEIKSPIDAIRFLTNNFPSLQSHMIEQILSSKSW